MMNLMWIKRMVLIGQLQSFLKLMSSIVIECSKISFFQMIFTVDDKCS